MANKNRGEVCIDLRGVRYILRPTFHAICAIEGELDISIIDILINISDKQLKISEIVVIIKHGMRAYKENPDISDEGLGNAVYDSGLINIMPHVIHFLELAVGMQNQEV